MTYIPTITKRYAVGLGDDLPLCSVAQVGEQCTPDDQTGTPTVVVTTTTPPAPDTSADDAAYAASQAKQAAKAAAAASSSSFPVWPVLAGVGAGLILYAVLTKKKATR